MQTRNAALALLLVLAAAVHAHTDIYLNSGGGSFVDSLSNTWLPDTPYVVGASSTFTNNSPIAGTTDDLLYQSERWSGSIANGLRYEIPVAPGEYNITLHFAEIWGGTMFSGARVFNISIEGAQVYSNMDIFSLVGASTALSRSFTVNVTDGNLSVRLSHVVQNPKISAIEVHDIHVVTPPPFAIRVNSGGGSFVDSLGQSWVADSAYVVGSSSTYVNNSPITGTTDDLLYQSERWSGSVANGLQYAFSVPNGLYNVTLHFAEIWSGTMNNGSRIFDVALEGTPVIDDLDIYSTAGASTALKRDFLVNVTDGNLSVRLSHVVQNPKISALEIVQVQNAIVNPPPPPPPPPALFTLRLNAGGQSYIDTLSRNWTPDTPYVVGSSATYVNNSQIAGTLDDTLYQSERFSGSITGLNYAIPVPNGTYNVTLHFAEIWSGAFAPGIRVFDTRIENTLFLDDFDVFALAGPSTALSKSSIVTVNDGALSISLQRVNQNPKISAIEVQEIPTSTTALLVTPNPIIFADTEVNLNNTLNITLTNTGATDVTVVGIAKNGSSPAFSFVSVPLYTLNPGNSAVFSGQFTPSNTGLETDALTITYTSNNGTTNASLVVPIQGTGVYLGHYAHAKAGFDQTTVDIDADGFASVTLDGRGSHTHAPAQSLNVFEWYINNSLLATGQEPIVLLPTGIHTITLFVADTSGSNATDDVVITVLAPDRVPGLAGYYYNFSGQTLSTLPPLGAKLPDWGQIESQIDMTATTQLFRGTPFVDSFAAQYTGFIDVPQTSNYTFLLGSDDGSRLSIDNTLLINNDGLHGMINASQSAYLTQGLHTIQLDYFEATGAAGLLLWWNATGNMTLISANSLFHNHSALTPVINSVAPQVGPLQGGNTVTVNGFGFVFDTNSTFLKLNNISVPSLTKIDDQTLSFIAPPGTGTKTITVQTANGVTNAKNYTYSAGALPAVLFNVSTIFSAIPHGPTTLSFGPDGRLYVGTFGGMIYALTLDENNTVTSVQNISSIFDLGKYNSTLPYCGGPCVLSRQILGITFNPLDDPLNPRIYVAHSNIYNGGVNAFGGKVSVLSGENFTNVTDVVTGLATSGHDHGVFGLEFGENGELYIQQGGMTNAGIPHPIFADLEESPLSAATLVAHIEQPDFDGNITYNGTDPLHLVQTGGFGVTAFATGERSAYDIVLHSNGNLYATDNGPNPGYGNTSIDCNTTGPELYELDELNLIREGNYYGSPNRNRGLIDSRECVYHYPSDSNSSVNYTAPLAILPSSVNGISEYRADTFTGQMRGHLITSVYVPPTLLDITLDSTGETVESVRTLDANYGGLDVTVGPDGTIYTANFDARSVFAHEPYEQLGTSELRVTGVFPYRGSILGNNIITFYVAGLNVTQNVSVSIDGISCPVTQLNSRRVSCVTPAGTSTGWKDVVVTNGQRIDDMLNAYQFLPDNFP